MKAKILIVDDEAILLHGLKSLLSAEDYEVVGAENGRSAVELFKKEEPDLVVLDVGLPDIDGFEVLERIMKFQKDKYIPVIFLTATVDMGAKIKAFHGGAVDYLTKPFSTAELLVRIENFLRIKKQHDMLKDESIHDKMTGVLNKVNFMKETDEELRRAFIYKKTAALIMADIDNFKHINDKYGHLAGDQVITELSSAIKRIIRPTDILGRFGGDEFVLLLPNTDAEGASFIAKRLIEEIGEKPVKYEKEELALSVSLGIADTKGRDIRETGTLVKLADKALYKAKKQKGNTFSIA